MYLAMPQIRPWSAGSGTAKMTRNLSFAFRASLTLVFFTFDYRHTNEGARNKVT